MAQGSSSTSLGQMWVQVQAAAQLGHSQRWTHSLTHHSPQNRTEEPASLGSDLGTCHFLKGQAARAVPVIHRIWNDAEICFSMCLAPFANPYLSSTQALLSQGSGCLASTALDSPAPKLRTHRSCDLRNSKQQEAAGLGHKGQ